MDKCSHCYIVDRAKLAYCPDCKKVKKTSKDVPTVDVPTVDVLKKIREEINGLIKYYPYPVVSPYQTNNYAMLIEDEVLQIIDKYRGGSK